QHHAVVPVPLQPASRVRGGVERLAEDTGHPVPGEGSTRTNRLTGLGALAGIAAGCGTGAAVAVLHGAGLRLPWWVGGPLTGALAMAAADLPMAGTKVSDPRTWSGKDWASDIVPHLAYGLVTYAVATCGQDRAPERCRSGA
ncbi:hypothetical protein ACWEP3_29170, partial [Streptomyces albidoflavus]